MLTWQIEVILVPVDHGNGPLTFWSAGLTWLATKESPAPGPGFLTAQHVTLLSRNFHMSVSPASHHSTISL